MTRPKHHMNNSRTLFQNPWYTPGEDDDNATGTTESRSWLETITNGVPSLVSSVVSSIPIEWARDLSGHGIVPTKVVKPKFVEEEGIMGGVKATWLGHASFLVEMPIKVESDKPIRMLFDPMFSDRAGPSAWTGIRRRLPSPCTIASLPEFQYVLISHNHYDHLDLASIQEIMRIRNENVSFLVPLGIKSWLLSSGIPENQIHELDWWDEITLPSSRTDSASMLSFKCVPAQHTSGRSVGDKCATLWCGWVVDQKTDEESSVRIYHSGDTGYMSTSGVCPVFEEIGQRYGPFSLAMIPIWRGGTLSFISQLGLRLTHHPLLSAMHASPADAVAIHRAVRSCHSLAMHFGTFAGTDAEALEPLFELMQARKEVGLGDWHEEGGIGAINVGETIQIETNYVS